MMCTQGLKEAQSEARSPDCPPYITYDVHYNMSYMICK